MKINEPQTKESKPQTLKKRFRNEAEEEEIKEEEKTEEEMKRPIKKRVCKALQKQIMPKNILTTVTMGEIIELNSS